MKYFIIILFFIGLMFLWILPAFVYCKTNEGGWGYLYVPIVVMSIIYGSYVCENVLGKDWHQ